MNENEVILVTREDVEQLVGRVVSNDDWDKVKEYLISDDYLWATIDACIKNTVDEVIL